MTKEDFKKHIKEIETQAKICEYEFQIANLFKSLLEENEEVLTQEQNDKLEWEFLLFRLATGNRFKDDDIKAFRFRPTAIFTNGNTFPDLKTFTPEMVDYYKERADECESPEMRARYADFIWSNSTLKDKHIYAKLAFDSYLETTKIKDYEAIFTTLDAFQRDAEIALSLESSKNNKRDLTERLVLELKNFIEKLSNDKQYRYLVEIFEIVAALHSFFTDIERTNYSKICDVVALYFKEEKNNYLLYRRFLELKVELAKSGKANSEEIKDLERAVAESHIEEVDTRAEEPMVQAIFLQKAIEAFDKIGDKDKVNELITKAKSLGTEASKSFKQFTTTYKPTDEEWEKLKVSLGTGKDFPVSLALNPNFFPDWEGAEGASKKAEGVFLQFANKFNFNGQYITKEIDSEEERIEDSIFTQFGLCCEMTLQLITKCIIDLKQEKAIKKSDFKPLIARVSNLSSELAEAFAYSIERFFKDDYYGCVMSLAPQLEDFLRRLQSFIGMESTCYANGSLGEKKFYYILLDLKPTLGDSIYHYTEWVLRDYRGLNLRNNSAHGVLKPSNVGIGNAMALIHLLSILCVGLQEVVSIENSDLKLIKV